MSSPLQERDGRKQPSLLSVVLAGELRRLGRLRDLFPWTALGVLLTGLAYAVLEWFAYAELDLVWLVVGYVGLGLTLLSPLLVALAAAYLRVLGPVRSADDALLLETGVSAETGYALPSLWFVPLVVVRWEWLLPQPAEVEVERRAGLLWERARLGDRGRFSRIRRRIIVTDVLGLSRVVFRVDQARLIDVLPRLDGLRSLPALTALASGDAQPHPMGLSEGDRLELRRYVPGDPARFIHWKVLSRTGKLMVRTPERALSIARRMAAFVIAGELDDASCAIARLAIEQRALGHDWIFGTDGEPAGVTNDKDALDALMQSSRERARNGEGLAGFAARVQQTGPASYVVFAPPRTGEWVAQVQKVAQRHPVRVVLGLDTVQATEPRSWLRRLLTYSQAKESLRPDEVEQLVSELLRASCSVSVVDRPSGRALGEGHLQGMLRLGLGFSSGAAS